MLELKWENWKPNTIWRCCIDHYIYPHIFVNISRNTFIPTKDPHSEQIIVKRQKFKTLRNMKSHIIFVFESLCDKVESSRFANRMKTPFALGFKLNQVMWWKIPATKKERRTKKRIAHTFYISKLISHLLDKSIEIYCSSANSMCLPFYIYRKGVAWKV